MITCPALRERPLAGYFDQRMLHDACYLPCVNLSQDCLRISHRLGIRFWKFVHSGFKEIWSEEIPQLIKLFLDYHGEGLCKGIKDREGIRSDIFFVPVTKAP